MLTYGVLDYSGMKRKEQTDADIIRRFYAVKAKTEQMTDDEFIEFLEAVGTVVCTCDVVADVNDVEVARDVRNAKALIKSYKIKILDAEIWYSHEEY